MAARRLRRAAALGAQHLPGGRLAEQHVRRAVLARDLRQLNDVLAETPLRDRYAVCGGLLLGWARTGKIVLNDVRDADFTYDSKDTDRFEAAAQALIAAGFEPELRFVNNDGEPAEHRFARHGVRYDFFALWHQSDRTRYYMYDETDELVCERDPQPLEPFEFVGRSWLKPVDHEAALTENYGDWQTDRADWHCSNAETVIERRPAKFGREAWGPR